MSDHYSQNTSGFEPLMLAGGKLPSTSFSHDTRRRNSIQEEIMMMAANGYQDNGFSDVQPLAKSHVIMSEVPLNSQPTLQTSILRRLTTKFRSPMGGSIYRSRPTQRRDYANIQDSSADYVPVDLSSLEGLGYELREFHHKTPGPYRHADEEDISYRSSVVVDDDDNAIQKPSFREFRKRRSLGAGMVIGAQLQPDVSKAESAPGLNHTASMADHLRRTQTVRQLGQNLAEERGQIIAYSEGVDLSSLEGARPKHRSSTRFEDMGISRTATMPDTQSYFFPRDPKIPNWKPFSMRPPYILMLFSVALGLAGYQEYLCQMSQRKQQQTPPTGLLAFDSLNDLSIWWFFAWKYLPTMITIIYAVAFSILDFDIRRLEPYYQLSQPHGSRASASLNLDHLTMFQYFVPFNAARLRQWAVFASTFGNIIAATVAPALQNPSINFESNQLCVPNGCPSNADPSTKRYWVVIVPAWSRPLSIAYVLVALILAYLFFQLQRKSGLLSDPRGIAGIASMATKSHILQDFKGLDLATRGDIHRRLAHRTYVLYKSSIWQGEWIPSTDQPQGDSDRRLSSPHPIMLRLVAGVPFIATMIVCLSCVPLISLTPVRIVPNAAPWLPILVATLLKMLWSTFEADVRLIEPFYQLSKGNALPQNSLTLDYQATVYGWMPIRAALNGHYLVAVVGLTSVCLDVLSVTVSSFSVDSAVFLEKLSTSGPELTNGDETYVSFFASLILSLTILCFAIFVASLVYARRRHPFLPREPSTIAAVLSFIYNSKMLTDFIDTETLTAKEMELRLKKLNKRYALGWFVGRNGKRECAIDEEPILSRYVHGKPLTAAVAGPLSMEEHYIV